MFNATTRPGRGAKNATNTRFVRNYVAVNSPTVVLGRTQLEAHRGSAPHIAVGSKGRTGALGPTRMRGAAAVACRSPGGAVPSSSTPPTRERGRARRSLPDKKRDAPAGNSREQRTRPRHPSRPRVRPLRPRLRRGHAAVELPLLQQPEPSPRRAPRGRGSRDLLPPGLRAWQEPDGRRPALPLHGLRPHVQRPAARPDPAPLVLARGDLDGAHRAPAPRDACFDARQAVRAERARRELALAQSLGRAARHNALGPSRPRGRRRTGSTARGPPLAPARSRWDPRSRTGRRTACCRSHAHCRSRLAKSARTLSEGEFELDRSEATRTNRPHRRSIPPRDAAQQSPVDGNHAVRRNTACSTAITTTIADATSFPKEVTLSFRRPRRAHPPGPTPRGAEDRARGQGREHVARARRRRRPLLGEDDRGVADTLPPRRPRRVASARAMRSAAPPLDHARHRRAHRRHET